LNLLSLVKRANLENMANETEINISKEYNILAKASNLIVGDVKSGVAYQFIG